MCGFVLLGGVQRTVPAQARVMVHQIWLGDRRDDPTAANYTAEDLVLVQRDIGRLAQYTIDMGGSIELLDLALRIPPWEPMHALTAAETQRTRLVTDTSAIPAVAATVAASPAAAAAVMRPIPRVTDGVQATAISERRWGMIDRAGIAALARRHPLTVEGEDIGSFDLMVACGAGNDSYDVRYVERRHDGGRIVVDAKLDTVSVTVGGWSASLKVASSERRGDPDELVTYATGSVSAALIGGFAAAGKHSMLVETKSAGMVTGIRLGNTGAQRNLPRLTAACAKSLGDRADLSAEEDRRHGGGEVNYSAACFALRLDLVERRNHRIEGEHGGGVARLVVAHRLEHRDIGPFAGGRRAVFLQHLAHGLAQARAVRPASRRPRGAP